MTHYPNGLPRRLTADELLVVVKGLVNEGGRVTFTEHALDRMEQRDVSSAQVLQVFRRGEVQSGPEWKAAFESWEFKMAAVAAGDLVTVVAAIAADPLMKGQMLLVITVIA